MGNSKENGSIIILMCLSVPNCPRIHVCKGRCKKQKRNPKKIISVSEAFEKSALPNGIKPFEVNHFEMGNNIK